MRQRRDKRDQVWGAAARAYGESGDRHFPIHDLSNLNRRVPGSMGGHALENTRSVNELATQRFF